ncbi:MAG: hypothetical protein UD936_10620 [Acutalibacteraceae bacterium]|nr:hypothetical protein [Acutalibacteraceae bacterium]
MAMLVDNQKMGTAYTDIQNVAKKFQDAGTTLITGLDSALLTFEGETKDALMEKKIGASGAKTEGTLANFVENQIYDLIMGLAKLLEGNREAIEKSDNQLAAAIRGEGQQ